MSNMNLDDDETFDVMFDAMMVADEALNHVVDSLFAVGVIIEPGQRHIVVKWLDMFATNTPIPLASRLAMLRGWLSA